MTNFEYYKTLIQAVGYSFAPLKDGSIGVCKEQLYIHNCEKCLLEGKEANCSIGAVKWLYEEYKEPPKLTKNERKLCEVLRDGYVKRDKETPLWSASKNMWWVLPVEALIDCNFSFIKEDEGMWSVKDLLKLEVE